MSTHEHRMDGQTLVHTHGIEGVRSDLRKRYEAPGDAMRAHGYFGHVEDAPGEDVGALEPDLSQPGTFPPLTETERAYLANLQRQAP